MRLSRTNHFLPETKTETQPDDGPMEKRGVFFKPTTLWISRACIKESAETLVGTKRADTLQLKTGERLCSNFITHPTPEPAASFGF